VRGTPCCNDSTPCCVNSTPCCKHSTPCERYQGWQHSTGATSDSTPCRQTQYNHVANTACHVRGNAMKSHHSNKSKQEQIFASNKSKQASVSNPCAQLCVSYSASSKISSSVPTRTRGAVTELAPPSRDLAPSSQPAQSLPSSSAASFFRRSLRA
jgi:hypothetical protein